MIERIVGLWNTKRWLFWLLLPVSIVAVVVKFYLDYLEAKSVVDMKETSEEANKLRGRQEEANRMASEKMAEVDQIEKKIEERKVEDIDVDWHLKK